MIEISLMYTLIVKPKKGRAIWRKGLIDKDLRDGLGVRETLADATYLIVDDGVFAELRKQDLELSDLQHMTIRFEKIEVE